MTSPELPRTLQDLLDASDLGAQFKDKEPVEVIEEIMRLLIQARVDATTGDPKDVARLSDLLELASVQLELLRSKTG